MFKLLAPAPLLAASLAIPTPVLAQAVLSSGSFPCTIALERDANGDETFARGAGNRFVKVRIGGKDLQMIFDTGAGATCLDPAVAKSLGLESKGSVKALGMGKGVPAKLVTLPGFELATTDGRKLRVRKHRAILLELKKLGSQLGRKVDGILGTPMFRHTPFTIDLSRERVTLHSAKSFVAPAGASKHPLRLVTGIPCARLALGASKKRWYAIDTGNAGTLILHPGFVSRLEIDKPFGEFPRVRGHGIGGSQKTILASVRDVSVGPIRFRGLCTTLVPSASAGMTANASLAGNIGSGVMVHGRFTFDYAARVLWIEAAKLERVALDPTLGLRLGVKGEAVVASSVLRKSSAREAGMRSADRILEIGGTRVGKDLRSALRALRERVSTDGACELLVKRPRDGDDAEPRKIKLRRRAWLPEIALRERGRR